MRPQPDNRSDRRRRASREMRRLLERLAQVNPWRYADPDRESVKCTFCGAPALAGTELAGRFHLDGCVWSDARRYLDEHPQQ